VTVNDENWISDLTGSIDDAPEGAKPIGRPFSNIVALPPVSRSLQEFELRGEMEAAAFAVGGRTVVFSECTDDGSEVLSEKQVFEFPDRVTTPEQACEYIRALAAPIEARYRPLLEAARALGRDRK